MGSVKELVLESGPADTILGTGKFVFSNDFSVFDWGKMPDIILLKGRVLCMMAAFNFELLEKNAVKTHYLGLLENGLTRKFEEVSEPLNEMRVMVTRKPELEFKKGVYDYARFRKKAGENFLVPLEIIFRNSVPVGSSVRKRFKPPKAGLKGKNWPDKNVRLEKPIIDFSTKLEAKDRYLSEKEAFKISCLSKEKFSELKGIALKVNKIITGQAERQGLEHEDGKIEMFYFRGELFVADVAGTFDENRFSFAGKEISKEVIRQYYKKSQPEWADAVEKAKAMAEKKKDRDWKKYCKIEPKSLPPAMLELVSEMYCAGANRYCGKEIFSARGLGEILEKLYSWRE
ncbi:MAG: phosphoribosylaminoimidazolesuccinocarboxamide synthase [Candidatus Diapherotrites archaeon]|nr:phosphoribosylaminoimidazolesuccinocarboxamide synthase [Candidatus Diapherotrites archaeon]